ncbi:hypothetical protein A0H81_03674 [Grifola frondosa]|uniref:DUF6741 domain-containing protein n=1 Tax=Grifola frondosa TaxID=5627 RepID=A0A1C7MJL1_GRIFR|nr:hypothetical protein A0H81_03674 [Grifola frondosa]
MVLTATITMTPLPQESMGRIIRMEPIRFILLNILTSLANAVQFSAYDDLDLRDPYYGGERLGTPYMRHRRYSSMSRSLSRHGRPGLDGYRRMSSTVIKFKRKGGFRSGITLGEAMSDAHLSGNDSYSLYDLNADHRGRIILKIRASLPNP